MSLLRRQLSCVGLVALAGTAAAAATPAGRGPELEATYVIPAEPFPASPQVIMGGLSDLFVTSHDAGGTTLWAITDRGPNGTLGRGESEQRTLLEPDFSPTLVKLRLAAEGGVAIEAFLPLTAGGSRMTGRPNGVGRDEPILDATTAKPVEADQDGVDTEGLVVMPDGSFWACEEYRPSLLKIDAAGRCLERHVPERTLLPHAAAAVVADIPAAYGDRRDNRGFEGLARSTDGAKLYVLLQSPLDHPRPKAAAETGNVRLLVADGATGRPVAEHVYRLGDPAAEGWGTRGAPPDDGKLCCLAPLPDGTLLVLEQADGGVARLYRVDLSLASDTLPRSRQGDGEPLELIGDLAAAGIRPVTKELVADLGELVVRMREDVFGTGGGKLKLEGLAVLDDRRILLGNDDDFGVHEKPGSPRPRSCLWKVRLGSPLPAHETLTSKP